MSTDTSLPANLNSLLQPSPICDALWEALEDGACLQTPDTHIIRANQAFAEIVGLPLAQIIGKTCAEIYCCGDKSGCAVKMPDCLINLQNPGMIGEEIHLGSPDRKFRTRAFPILDEAGNKIAFLMTMRQLPVALTPESSIARQNQRAQFGELAASLAHEIKNPLAGIQGVVDILLQRRNAADPEREILENVRHEVQRIDATIQALLNRAQANIFSFQPASLTETVQRAAQIAQKQAENIAASNGRKIKVEFLLPSDPLVMNIDVAQIEEALGHLIVNAIEAVEGHGEIIVNLQDQPDEIIIEVKDNGRGINEADLFRIFSPFFTTQERGLGLGLPTVRRIARAHGGQIEVNSLAGEGTSFLLRLPRQLTPQPA